MGRQFSMTERWQIDVKSYEVLTVFATLYDVYGA